MHRSDAHDWHLPPHPPTNSSGNLEWEVDVWNIAKLLQVRRLDAAIRLVATYS